MILYAIVTHFFEKDGVIGSVRWTNFAHRLSNDYTLINLLRAQGILDYVLIYVSW